MKTTTKVAAMAIATFAITETIRAQTTVTGSAVSFHQESDGELEIRVGDSVFGVFNHGSTWNKPFLFPVYTAKGTNVLRDILATKADQGTSKEGTDHFHHKGIWVSVDSVNDERLNFWHEEDRIRNESVSTEVLDGGSGRLTVHNTWLQGDKPLLKETTVATFHPSRLVVYQIELTAIDKDVTIYDTKEGFFAVRVAHTMREMQGGKIVNADGLKGEKNCWGKPTPWIDYSGEVNGATCGVTLMDHPDNFRKSRYHVRGYGLFGISPFGPHKYSNGKLPAAPVTISPGKTSLKLTYGLYVHDGDAAAGQVADTYQEFLKVTP